MNFYNNHKKQYEKDQQIIQSFDNFYRKLLQDNVVDKNEYECLCEILLDFWRKRKMNVFYKFEHEKKLKFFSNNLLIFNLEPGSKKSVYV